MMNIRSFLQASFISLLFVFAVSCNENDDPIPVPLEMAYENGQSWHWVDKEEMIGRTGLPSGYAVNFNRNSSQLIIYLEGGGACFNDLTCLQNPSKFDENDFMDRIVNGGQGETGIYSRTSNQNPFKDWNFVYIPYTTGDVHSGNNPDTKRVGFRNVMTVLNDIAPFFSEKGITEVFLSGASGGGYGALINYNQVAESFPDLDISMIADSSPLFFDTEIYPDCLNERFETTFNIQFPSDLVEYTSDTYPYKSQRIYEYLSNKYPDAQFGFFSYYEDETIRYFYGFGKDECADEISPIGTEAYKSGLLEMADVMNDLENWEVFFEDGSSHTVLFSDEFENMTVSNVPFTSWLGQLNQKTAVSVMR
jgi:hypothetical protein